MEKPCTKILALVKSTHEKQNDTLAEYYVKTNSHLIGEIMIMEYDLKTDSMRTVYPSESTY